MGDLTGKPTGRPKKTIAYRLDKLFEDAIGYIEDCAKGIQTANAARLTLSWRLVGRMQEKEDPPKNPQADQYAEVMKGLQDKPEDGTVKVPGYERPSHDEKATKEFNKTGGRIVDIDDLSEFQAGSEEE